MKCNLFSRSDGFELLLKVQLYTEKKQYLFITKEIKIAFPDVMHDVVDEVGGGEGGQGKDGHVVPDRCTVVKCALRSGH